MRNAPKLASLFALTPSLLLGACIPDFQDLAFRILSQPGALEPGDELVVSSEVCNLGTVASDPTWFELLLRAEGDHGTAQPIGGEPVPPLAPNECRTVDSAVWIPFDAPTGAYEIVGVVDPHRELDEDRLWNNIGVSGAFGVGWAPDLLVESLAYDPIADKNEPFEVDARVCNQGLAPAPETDLLVLLSLDQELSLGPPPEPPAPPDWPAGSLDVPELFPGQCAQVAGTVSTGPDPGPLWIGAVVDDAQVVDETVESNNTFVGGRMGIGMGPDLVIEWVDAPASVAPGEWIDLAVRVCNQGNALATDVGLSLHLSPDPLIMPGYPDPATGDPHVGDLPVGNLDAGACGELSLLAPLPEGLTGPVYPGAYVDDAMTVEELLEGNNGRAGALMGLGFGPDLVVTDVTAPPSVDGPFDAEVRVCNQGTTQSEGARLALFLSADDMLEPQPEGADPEVGYLYPGEIDPGDCFDAVLPSFATVGFDVPAPGTYRLFARVDVFDELPELIETNNDLAGGEIGVGSEPDLIVTSVDGPPSADGPFSATARVCNQGTVHSTEATLTFYHSLDPVIQGGPAGPGPGPPDEPAGDVPLPPLPPGSCLDLLAPGLSPSVSGPGAYWLGAFADDWDEVFELNELNNGFADERMGIGYGPDLVVTRVEGPPSVLPGGPVTLDVQVCNVGTAFAGATDVHLYGSIDGVIQGNSAGPMAADPLLTILGIGSLPPGACTDALETVTLPSELYGIATVGGIVDEYDDVPGELIEDNNTLAGSQIAIGADPNLVVEALSGDPSVEPGNELDVQATVCNRGTLESDWVDLSLYFSADAQVDGGYFDPGSGDPFEGFHPVPPILPGACELLALEVQPPVPDGAWYLAAVVNEGQHLSELRFDDNDRLGSLVAVGFGPDLVVTSVVAPGGVQPGVDFQVDATVCNQGTSPAGPSGVGFYHSFDATITPVPVDPGAADEPLDWLPTPALLPGACEVHSATVQVWPPAPGSFFVGAYADEGDDLPELVEGNNARAQAYEVY